MPLKKADVNRATCPPDKKSVLLSDGDGLLLRITSPNNLKGWVYRYTFNGKRTMTTIGSLDERLVEAIQGRLFITSRETAYQIGKHLAHTIFGTEFFQEERVCWEAVVQLRCRQR